MPVKPPAEPVPAATLVLVRDRPAAGFELLLIQRHRASKFAAGDFVFPGGKVEHGDSPTDATRWCVGLDSRDAARVLGRDAETALAYWIGVIRETFEEVGVLLAYDAAGVPARVDVSTCETYRQACRADHQMFWTMVRAEDLRLATDRLVYFAHWITPEESPLRFDTRFFVTEMPAGQEAKADGHEIVDVRWLAPSEALLAASRGEISLRNPTARNIELFDGASSAAEAVHRLRSRRVTTIRPRVVVENGQRRILMPGDPGYY